MMKNKLKKGLILFGILMMVSATAMTGSKVFANELNFAVKTNLPENQITKTSYFNLLLNPGQKQTLTVQLSNSTDKQVVVEESIASTTTNVNGVVEYSPNNIKADKSLKYNLKDYVKAPSEVTLAPKSSQNVKIQVSMPEQAVMGVMAGGITYKEKASDNIQQSKAKKGVTIQNQYAYVVGILLQNEKVKVAPNLKLNQVGPGQVNYRNVINANLQNPEAGYLNQLYVQANVKGLSNSKLSYTSNKEMMQMAPDSNFDYPIALGEGRKLEPGKYRLTLTAYGQKDRQGKFNYKDAEGNIQKFDYQWKFVRDFTITGKAAQEFNAKDVTIKPTPWWANWMIWLGILLVLLALFFFFFIWKRRKKDEEEDEKNAEIAALKKQLKEQLEEQSEKQSE